MGRRRREMKSERALRGDRDASGDRRNQVHKENDDDKVAFGRWRR